MDTTVLYQKTEHQQLIAALENGGPLLRPYTARLAELNDEGWQKVFQHGDYQRWSNAFSDLPEVETGDTDFKKSVRIGRAEECQLASEELKETLLRLKPWRKGPFDVFGVHINTEWRSDWKWERVLPHISSLKDKRILDIGCGSGYHLWRMYGEGASLVLGIDTSPLFPFHFGTIKRYQPQAPVFLIPTGIDEMPDDMESFDHVFSMGILYHRKQPLEHLMKIRGLLKKGGELVLETLVVDGDAQTCLVPKGRYAKMKNVWFIPSVAMLSIWLQRCGFSNVRCVDLNVTSVEEQRATEWMQFESLSDYLDPNDANKTVEGYQAPTRAVIIANV